jgi:hypothetical protein
MNPLLEAVLTNNEKSKANRTLYSGPFHRRPANPESELIGQQHMT